MDMLPMAMILAKKADGAQAHSALPNAPVVPHTERRSRAPRTRAALAHLLERTAQAVAPRQATSCNPAH
jgi:hypothetical protein